PVQERLAAGRCLESRQDVQEQGLPRRAGTEQADELARRDLEGEAIGGRDDLAGRRAPRDHQIADREPGLRGNGRLEREGLDHVGHQRRRNFSAISTWTTLPSWTTRTTVPNWILRRMSATFARTSFSSSVSARPASCSSACDFEASTISRPPSAGWYAVGRLRWLGRSVLLQRKRPRAREARPRPPVLWSAAASHATSPLDLGQCGTCPCAFEILGSPCISNSGSSSRLPSWASPWASRAWAAARL